MEQAFGYYRVSGGGQVDKDGPIRQRKAIDEYCKANNLNRIQWFHDLAVSGTVEGLDRPGFMDMIVAAETQGVAVIVVENLDRLARDLIVSEVIIREIKKRGLKLFATDQGKEEMTSMDKDPSRKLIRQILGAVAEFQKSSTVLRLRCARERIRAKTGRCEGAKPMGQNKREIVLLNTITEMRGQNMSYEGIAKMLTFGNMKKRRGNGIWTAMDVWRYHTRNIANQKKERQKNEHILPTGDNGQPAN